MATTINVILADSTTAITVSTGARGPAGAGNNSITSATTSDGTAALYIDSLRFETTNGGPTQLGEMAWDSSDGSIDAMLESGLIVAMGEDLVIRVRNTTASPIAKGTALAYDGTTGASGRIEVKPWVDSNITTAKLFLGFAASDMTANGDGYSQWFGKLAGINTSGDAQNWQAEQIIYAVPGTSATLTNVAPTSGEYAAAAVVMFAGSGTSGILYVRPTFEAIQSITTATETNINGLLKGNGSTVSAATAGTDYQAALVSGTNLKTLNGESLLGAGDIDTDPVAKTWAGTNPNIPENLTITGTTPAAPASIPRSVDVEGYPSWDVLTWYVLRISGVWNIASPTLGYEAQKASDALTPVGLTDWTVINGTGQPTLTGDNPAGDYLGQLLQASDDSWWRWNGSEWEQDVVDNASVNTAIEDDPAATRTALGGGAAGQEVFQAADYSGAGSVRKLAGLDVDDSPQFFSVNVGSGLTAGINTSNFAALQSGANGKALWDSNSFRTLSGVYLGIQNPDTRITRKSSGKIQIGASASDSSGAVEAKNLTTTPSTVADLTAAATAGAGARAFVSDSTVAASGNFGAVVAGGGANAVPVYSDGTDWRIG
jgi:hypothetical protein